MFKDNWLFVMGTTLFAYATMAQAGVGSSGGGGAQVCRDSQGLIQFAELLDLYEAREFYGGLVESAGTLEGDYLQAVRNTYQLQGAGECLGGPCFKEARVRENLKNFMARVDFLPSGQHLPLLGDFGRTIPPLSIPGCGYEQLAVFHDDLGRVSVDPEIWRALSTRDQAALVVHETNYKYERELRENTSEGTRALVAAVFARPGAVHATKSGLPANALHCFTSKREPSDGRAQGGVSDFYLYTSFAPNGEPTGLSLQFTHLMGRPMLSQTIANLTGARTKWNIGLGDPEKREDLGDYSVVWEKGAADTRTVNVFGDQTFGWELKVEYAYRKPVLLTLLKQGKVVESAPVNFCD